MEHGRILASPSLLPQWKLAEALYGESGAKRVTNWIEQQIERVSDAGFARLFSDHIKLDGIASPQYNHRLVQSGSGFLLGGIRFFGGDVGRPFAEIIAHSFDNLGSLLTVIGGEWSAFAPEHARITVGAGSLPSPNTTLDVSIHAARYSRMRTVDDHVLLQPFERVEDAVAMVSERYHELSRENPDLAKNISPATAEELRDCAGAGHLFGVTLTENESADPVGLIATRDGAVDWIEGHEVVEEIVVSEQSGLGIALSAQKALAALRREHEAEQILVGTIDRLNHASRITAERAGRAEVLRKVFIPLTVII